MHRNSIPSNSSESVFGFFDSSEAGGAFLTAAEAGGAETPGSIETTPRTNRTRKHFKKASLNPFRPKV
jgi:hypothetical protein